MGPAAVAATSPRVLARGAQPPPAGAMITVETPQDQAAAKAILGTQLSHVLASFADFLVVSMQIPPDRATEAKRREAQGMQMPRPRR
mmetsp:Transcript_101962/g.283755  ORF Transcript_101962/g.283755 Transcript_101962/m.283755 type:complete len:87 (-) Transcript_101962:33-293(-)